MTRLTRLAALAVCAAACPGAADASAAPHAYLSVKHARSLITHAERQGMQTNPTYTGFKVGACFRLSATRINCALTRTFGASSCPARIIVFLHKGYPGFLSKADGACVTS